MSICRCAVAVVILSGVVHAQDKAVSPTADPLAALTAEVRQLRLAIEKATQVQTQIQGLSVYLSAQQSRLIQVSGRLDVARGELDRVALNVRDLTNKLVALSVPPNQPVAPEMRIAIEQQTTAFKNELKLASEHEAQLRARESATASELQTELARWTDLISRLEQLIRQ